jgi:hypothetical protein
VPLLPLVFHWGSSWSQASSCGICGGKVALGEVFLNVLQFLMSVPPTSAPLIFHSPDNNAVWSYWQHLSAMGTAHCMMSDITFKHNKQESFGKKILQCKCSNCIGTCLFLKWETAQNWSFQDPYS